MNDVDSRLKHLGVIVTFSEWSEDQDAVQSNGLETVWMHITGIPHPWRHYLSLWAVGTVVGSTMQVDMYTFRKKKEWFVFRWVCSTKTNFLTLRIWSLASYDMT